LLRAWPGICCTAAAVALLAPAHALALDAPRVSEDRAIAIAEADHNAVDAKQDHPDLHPSAQRSDTDGDWEVGFFANDDELVQVIVDDTSGEVEESWTGSQVAWKMARGYEGAFGRAVNAPYVWLPLCALFVLLLVDWRRPFRVAHLDLLVLTAGFGVSHYFFNRGDIGLSVPLAYPVLLYLLGRALWLAFRGGDGLRPSVPATWLAVVLVAVVGFRVALNVEDSNVIDVGYSGVIGADRITDGKTLYGNFPSDNQSGDTYGPVAYYSYVPFEQLLPWSGRWDELPAAHAASIFFDLATIGALFLVGRRLRPGRPGTDLGILLAFAWAACPYTAYALESNTNDALVALLLTATLLFLTSPPARGVMLALASATKFAPLALAPLFATYSDSNSAGEGDVNQGGSATGGAVGGPIRGRIRARRMGGPTATGPVARFLMSTVGPFALAFTLTLLVVSAEALIDPGLATFWHRTIGEQAGRQSPFSIWGQADLEWLHTLVKAAVAGLALLVAFRPRRRDAVTVAALGAAVLIALQLVVEHWFYLYIPWFLPFLFVALLARPTQPREPIAAR
jgi:hypothetical protein